MKFSRLLAIAILCVPGASFAERQLTADQNIVSHDCADDDTVTVDADENLVTITGACRLVRVKGEQNQITLTSAAKIEVTGSQNHVKVEAVDAMRIPGSQNWITYRRTLSKKKGAKPTINSTGHDNVISRGE
jgi:hypothetical protein